MIWIEIVMDFDSNQNTSKYEVDIPKDLSGTQYPTTGMPLGMSSPWQVFFLKCLHQFPPILCLPYLEVVERDV